MGHQITSFINEPFTIGSLQFSNRLIQGPLAGFTCAPFRRLYYQFVPPAYCVSEMISAFDIVYKHQMSSRYLFRAPEEKNLCYQIAGNDPSMMAAAAQRLESIGADLIDINAGCPKTKIRKKGAGSALLDDPVRMYEMISRVRDAIRIPLTVKLRIHGDDRDFILAQEIERAGADALIIHGRRWTDDYDIPSDFYHIKRIKQETCLPVIANGDIRGKTTLAKAIVVSGCDAYMIGRGGSGKPWLYQQLLTAAGEFTDVSPSVGVEYFLLHLQGLSTLESEHQAVLQSKTLVRYYFKELLSLSQLQAYYQLTCLGEIEDYLKSSLV